MVIYSGSQFRHQPLDTSRAQIRVLCVAPEAGGLIQCTIKHIDLNANPAPFYRALSYTWGSPEDTQEISVNGRSLEVRRNLHDFLVAFRARLFNFRGGGVFEEEVQWLWIDQICVDQAVIHERNHQVQMMADIYKKANYVYVWLGASNPRTEAVMTAIKSNFRLYHLARQRPDKGRKKGPDFAPVQDERVQEPLASPGLQHFFSNPYWLRLWIVQEIMLARYIRVLCGETILSWEELQRFCTSGLKNLPSEAAQAVPAQILWLTEHALGAKNFTYPSLLWTFVLNGCHEPRDKAYGFQGLLPEAQRMQIDYDVPVKPIFQDIARNMLDNMDFIPRIEYGQGLLGLEYRDSVEDVFKEAMLVLKQKSWDYIGIRVVQSIITLGDQMGLETSVSQAGSSFNRHMRSVEAKWSNLISCYMMEHSESSIKEIGGDSFILSLAYLAYAYQDLTLAIRQLLLYIVESTGDKWDGAWSDSTHDIWGKFPQYIAEPKPALDFVLTSLDQRTWRQTTKWYQIDMAFSPIWTVGRRIASNSETQYHCCQEFWLWSKDKRAVNAEYNIATRETSQFKFDNSVCMRVTLRNPLMKIESLQTIFLVPESTDQESTGMFTCSVIFSEIPEGQAPSREPDQWELSFNFDLVDLITTDHTTRVSCVTFRHPSPLIRQWAPRSDNSVSQVTPVVTHADVELERSANVVWETGG